MTDETLPTLRLPPGHVDLWLLSQEEVRDPQLLTRYRTLLTDEERVREKRFHFLKDQQRYLVTRVLIRAVLSRYSTVRAHEWRFEQDAYGRPYFTNPDASAQTLSFNISHSGGIIACAVARASAIGVDVESFARDPAPLDVAYRYFSVSEVAALQALPPAWQQRRFFEYWVLKESYIKAIGKGLSVPLDQMSFDLRGDSGVELSFAGSLPDQPARWQFLLLEVFAGYLLAICVDRSAQEYRQLTVRKMIPFVVEEALVAGVLRRSDVEVA